MNQVSRGPTDGLLIDGRNLVKVFQRNGTAIRALNGVSIQIFRGEFVSIAGRNGSGKSTLLGIMSGMERVTSGSVLFDAVDLNHAKEVELTRLRARSIGFIFQEFNLLRGFTVYENVEAATVNSGLSQAAREAAITGLLDRLGIRHRAGHYPSELSAGEQQRAAIARAMVNKPIALFADEPTAEVDPAVAKEIAGLLIDLNVREHVTIILATHGAVEYPTTRQYFMRSGELVTRAEAGY
jgi:putative ABC transport system ATP-binding protein